MLQIVELFVKLFVIFVYVIWPMPQHQSTTATLLDVNLTSTLIISTILQSTFVWKLDSSHVELSYQLHGYYCRDMGGSLTSAHHGFTIVLSI